MDGLSFADLVQAPAIVSMVWLFWQTEKANRAEREAMRLTLDRIGAAMMVVAMKITGAPPTLPGGRDNVQP